MYAPTALSIKLISIEPADDLVNLSSALSVGSGIPFIATRTTIYQRFYQPISFMNKAGTCVPLTITEAASILVGIGRLQMR